MRACPSWLYLPRSWESSSQWPGPTCWGPPGQCSVQAQCCGFMKDTVVTLFNVIVREESCFSFSGGGDSSLRLSSRITAYSSVAPATNMMAVNSQREMEVIPGCSESTIKMIRWIETGKPHSPSTVGDFELMVLNVLMRTRNMVTRRPILPGTTAGEMKKLIQLTRTNRPEGRW